jgi:AraC family transcriptional regulator, transcriptional activator of the genes for pyochelin and ferripyochelin receptors
MTAFEREAVETASQLLLQDIRKDISITHLVEKVGIAQSKLKATFKELYGMSIYAFITYHRVEKAKDLLINTNLTVEQISRTVGYKRIDSFSRRFKQVTKNSPDHYRKQNR